MSTKMRTVPKFLLREADFLHTGRQAKTKGLTGVNRLWGFAFSYASKNQAEKEKNLIFGCKCNVPVNKKTFK